jgi:hypothetical protein
MLVLPVGKRGPGAQVGGEPVEAAGQLEPHVQRAHGAVAERRGRLSLPAANAHAQITVAWGTAATFLCIGKFSLLQESFSVTATVKLEQIRTNVFTLTVTSQELSALVAAARMTLDVMQGDPQAPQEATELLARVLRDYDRAVPGKENGRSSRPSIDSPDNAD